MKDAFIHIGIIFGFFSALIALTYLLGMFWLPLGFLPFAAYTVVGVRFLAKRCICGHRFISHNNHMRWCAKCLRAEDAFVWDPAVGDVRHQFCTDPRTAAEEMQRLLDEHTP